MRRIAIEQDVLQSGKDRGPSPQSTDDQGAGGTDHVAQDVSTVSARHREGFKRSLMVAVYQRKYRRVRVAGIVGRKVRNDCGLFIMRRLIIPILDVAGAERHRRIPWPRRDAALDMKAGVEWACAGYARRVL